MRRVDVSKQRSAASGLEQRCNQCWQWKPWPAQFIGRKGRPIGFCTVCTGNYRGWYGKTPEQKAAIPRRGVPATTALSARLYLRSQNTKLGGIPASVTSRGTCPASCAFYDHGCFASYGKLASHWRRVGESGDSWAAFVDAVAQLPEGQLWRHNTAGDLPGDGERIDGARLAELVMAAAHTRAFTFTHLHRSARNLRLIRKANASGFVINLSADSLAEADRLYDTGAGPVAVVVERAVPDRGTRTPAGRRVVVCPAQTDAGLTCAECRLCAHPTRRCVVAFRAHGQAAARVEQLVQLRRA